MKIILATSNKHKVLELKEILKDFEIYAFDEVVGGKIKCNHRKIK